MRPGAHHDRTVEPGGETAHSWPGLAVAVGAFLSIVLIGGAEGGYHPDAWGWIVLGFAWMAALALVLRRQISVGVLEVATCAALSLLTAWVGASIVWSDDVPQSVFELERAFVYLVGLVTVLVAVRRRSLPWFAGGLLAGITAVCVAALVSRLFPSEGVGSDVILVNRLSDPIGYWNGLGIFAGMGALIALGAAAHAERMGARVAAAAAMPVLLTTLYFTYSRGSWIALAIGAVAAVAIDPRRLALVTTGLVLAPTSVIAVAVSSSSEALTRLRAPHDQIVDDGRKLALLLLLAVALSAGLALAKGLAERRVQIRVGVRRAYAVALAAVAVVGVVVVLVHLGGPVAMAEDAYEAFKDENPAPGRASPRRDLNQRLFTLRSNGRVEYWEASWDQNQDRPLTGQGAGSFEQYWLRERPFPSQIKDAHGLYVETLGEIGWIGLFLLVLTLGLPLMAALLARTDPLVPGAFGALIAYVAHAGVDWDWEVPAVTLVALACAAVLLVCARASAPRRLTLGTPGRVVLGVGLAAVTAFSAVGLVGNRATGKAEAAADAAHWNDAEREARTATDWAPWSGTPWLDLGRAQLGLRRPGAARASLLKAVDKDPREWRAWYYLGSASRGRERQHAYTEAARLNPFAKDIEPLRKRYHLPKAPEPSR